MNRFTAILIGTAVFASVYAGAYVNNRRSEPARTIPIVWVQRALPITNIVAIPKPAHRFTMISLSGVQPTLHVALVGASCEAIRGCKR